MKRLSSDPELAVPRRGGCAKGLFPDLRQVCWRALLRSRRSSLPERAEPSIHPRASRSGNNCGGAEQPDYLLCDLTGWLSHVNSHSVLTRIWFLKSIDLAQQQ